LAGSEQATGIEVGKSGGRLRLAWDSKVEIPAPLRECASS
jgi:hypothetical protein